MRISTHLGLAAFAALVVASPAVMAQDLAKGEALFRRCAVCHGLGDATKPVGPNLNNVIGRTAGTLEEFASKYSPAMKKAGADGLAWTVEDIDAYITDPKKKVPGNKMAFPGLRKADERADVIAYIATFSKEAAAPATSQ